MDGLAVRVCEACRLFCVSELLGGSKIVNLIILVMYVLNTVGVLFDPLSLLVVKDKGSSGDNNDGSILKA